MELKDTKLWKLYEKKTDDIERRSWVEKVYNTAVEELKLVPATFPNYTLHDATHVLNVLHAMAGLLGDQAENLTVAELELLILSAALHDIGMVYTEADRDYALADEQRCKDFVNEKCPDLYGADPQKWPDDIKQWYWRERHPFRVDDVLNKPVWEDLFRHCPDDILPRGTIVAVCRSHGVGRKEIQDDPELNYNKGDGTDPRFCALLLRLADLLDFDDTRTPKILLEFAAGSDKSTEEWKKHLSSKGFNYPDTPSPNELGYRAVCASPDIEHAIRDYLNWIDEELYNCRDLQRQCFDWRAVFPFPLRVSRENITNNKTYVSDDFKLTMDQAQILKLLSGENLYSDNTVFVRELLQNAVDATLLRGKMDTRFDPEDARIDLWEWTDAEGHVYFRIDDQGTGMTQRMLKNYFLKVGNSYYTSNELKSDLQNHHSKEGYYGISRFGIGFLSCFLCGVSAEVSTLYFDAHKCGQERGDREGSRLNYGLRMNVTGLEGYYVLQSQAEGHRPAAPLPAAPFAPQPSTPKWPYREFDNYRNYNCPGTSIVIKLDPDKLGAISLKKAAQRVICGTRMKIYYNGERIGRTYREIMDEAHRLAGSYIYELTCAEKDEFDRCFPKIKGHYPKISAEVIPLDTDEFRIHPKLSGVVVRRELCLDASMRWEARDQSFRLDCNYQGRAMDVWNIFSHNVHGSYYAWSSLLNKQKIGDITALRAMFATFLRCPDSPKALGEVWLPFRGIYNLYDIWKCFVNDEEERTMHVELSRNRSIPLMQSLTGHDDDIGKAIYYQGILASKNKAKGEKGIWHSILFMEDELQPEVDIGRTKITNMSLSVFAPVMAVAGLPRFKGTAFHSLIHFLANRHMVTIQQWREICNGDVGKKILKKYNDRLLRIVKELSEKQRNNGSNRRLFSHVNDNMRDFFFAYIQDSYELTIDFPAGQIMTLEEKQDDSLDVRYDWFPPMLFSKAGNAESRNFLCHKECNFRKGINQEHSFAKWLLDNAKSLNKQFGGQFWKIVHRLRYYEAKGIIEAANSFRDQLEKMRLLGRTCIPSFKPLSKEDFWSEPDE